jgi:hypothetical protein
VPMAGPGRVLVRGLLNGPRGDTFLDERTKETSQSLYPIGL